MKKYYLFLLLAAPFFGFSQNNAPVAVNDTFYVDFNDSIWSVEVIYPTISVGLLLENDSDPDADRANITDIIYSGTNSIQLDSMAPGNTHFRYKPLNGFVGIDSLQYIITDIGTPTMSDTAWAYIKVKHSGMAFLDLNNIRAGFGLNQLFHDAKYSIPSFEVPKGDTTFTMYAGNLWVAGKYQDSIFNSSMTYGDPFINDPQHEFNARSGPVMDSIYYPEYSYKWDRHWKVNAVDITYHQNNWSNPGYVPIEVIKNWPAHGDTAKGQAWELAPFYDRSGDGIYDPMDGDHPLIKGTQAIYFIYNDMRMHPYLHVKPMQLEVHYMAYAYHCPEDSAINNSIFMDFAVYNRSSNAYDSTYTGFWSDFDIGGSSDDYVGSDVEKSTFYSYNADSIDEGGNGLQGYQYHPPAQGIVHLKGSPQDVDGIDNPLTNNVSLAVSQQGMVYQNQGVGFGDGIIDNEYWGMVSFIQYTRYFGFPGFPQPLHDPQSYYNMLHSYLSDTVHLVWGGNGNPYSTGGTVPTKHYFPGASDPLWYGTDGIVSTPTVWDETSATMPARDATCVGGSGPFTFYPGQRIDLSFAFVFGRDYTTPGNTAGIAIMQERVDSIHSYYRNGFTTTACGQTLSVNEKELDENDLSIYPNPFNNQLTIEYELENESGEIRIISLYGQVIQNQVINQNRTTIDLSELANGIYLVQLIDGNKIISKRVLKQ